MRILHAYKVYLPAVYRGIPSVIATLATLPREEFETEILVARACGVGGGYEFNGVKVEAVSSLATVMSTPLAPTYPFRLFEKARSSDVVVHHAPFPLTDIGLALLPKKTTLIVHWHAEVVGRRWLMRVLAPFIRNSLRRADRIVVSDPVIVEKSPFLKPFAAKCVAIPYGCDNVYWERLNPDEQQVVDRLKKQHPRLVVAVGRLVSYKGYEVFVRAMQNVDTEAVIIGEGQPISSRWQESLVFPVALRFWACWSLTRSSSIFTPLAFLHFLLFRKPKPLALCSWRRCPQASRWSIRRYQQRSPISPGTTRKDSPFRRLTLLRSPGL
jgi:rhamnosyl/mannosyltransferase